jgi:AraC-like DNA-binding protein
MSQRIDPASPASAFIEFSTDHVAPRERLDFLYATTGKRMECAPADGERALSVQVRGLMSSGVNFLDYTARGITMDRTAAMCDDGHDHISVGLVAGSRTAAEQNGREIDLATGELYVIDFARPVRSLIPDHHEMAISLPRARVTAALGTAIDTLGGLRLDSRAGIGAVLASHMRALAEHAASLDPAGRAVGLQTAADLALAALQTRVGIQPDPQALDHLYMAARAAIRRNCADPEFNSERLAGLLGCSRTALYRLFARHGESVAAAIWSERLERARAMLASGGDRIEISEIAFHSGFLDPATFSRMFKRRYGVTAREMRDAAGALDAPAVPPRS